MADMSRDFPVKRFLAGFYRVEASEAFANVKRERSGEHKGKWSTEIRSNGSGDLIQYAGVWNTMREGVEEACRVLTRYDAGAAP